MTYDVMTETQCEPPSQRRKERSFIQDRVHQNELVINGVPGSENMSDLLTKNLNRPQTIKRTEALGLESIHNVNLCAVSTVRSCLFLAGLLDSVLDSACFEWERFVGLCELQTTFGSLLIEFCTDPHSSFVATGSDLRLRPAGYLGSRRYFT